MDRFIYYKYLMTQICLWSYKWSHLMIENSKYTNLLSQYPATDDGYIHVVWGILRDEQWCIYLHHDARLNEFRVPGGKVEMWETYSEALIRELREELSIEVISSTYQYTIKRIAWWMKRCFHLFVIDSYLWIPQNNDSHKYDQYRAEIIDSDSSLGFAIKIGGTITDDVQDIMHSFVDIYNFHTNTSKILSDISRRAVYRNYNQTTIDLSRHYYLYLDQELGEYYVKDVW
jgi:8-oxo-dGTP pyrophosphatase MutT (NUDIX family)